MYNSRMKLSREKQENSKRKEQLINNLEGRDKNY